MGPSGHEVIASRNNPLIRRIQALQTSRTRESERFLVLEGRLAVQDAVDAGFTPELLVVSDSFPVHELSNALSEVEHRRVSESLFLQISQTVSPQGIMALVPEPLVVTDPGQTPLILVSDAIRDPGNLGSIIRSAAASGATSVVLTPGCVDPANPKVVRSAMGGHFRIPILHHSNQQLRALLSSCHQVVAAIPGAATTYDQIDFTLPTTILIGSEATGLAPDVVDLASHQVSIPMHSASDSLNAAMAASVLLFEAQRQRLGSV